MDRIVRQHFYILMAITSILVLGAVNAFATDLPLFALITLVLSATLVASRWSETATDSINQPGTTTGIIQNALDFANDGIVVLNDACCMTYANQKFCRLFQILPHEIGHKRAFSELLKHGALAGFYQWDESNSGFVWKDKIAAIKMGENAPVTLRMADGSTVRLSISLLPDGGSMVICSNITDLTHDAERLEELAHVDSLTGLLNRRRFFDLASREWLMSTRYGRNLTVLMIDLDYFKAVNDTYGHDAGDQAIRFVANICQESKRATDLVARLGGEEFAILLPETDIAGAKALAERIRARVAARPLYTGGNIVALTMSIGVAEREPDTKDFDALLKLGDQRLYAAKHAGRNCVISSDAPADTIIAKSAAA